jgi:hypothetical protein
MIIVHFGIESERPSRSDGPMFNKKLFVARTALVAKLPAPHPKRLIINTLRTQPVLV